MAPPAWALSVPVGFVWTFAQRIMSLVLQTMYGVPLNIAQGREQPMSKEVAMKDTDGWVRVVDTDYRENAFFVIPVSVVDEVRVGHSTSVRFRHCYKQYNISK